jgi:hypothetical protein
MIEGKMDVGTGLALFGSAQLVEKLLGPTFQYLGEGLKEWTEQRIINVRKIFDNAQRILGDRLNEPGAVPPKVLKGILVDGSFCDDELTSEYFAGVLASSRSRVTRDDRGATFINLLSRLSSYQIRSHYIIYLSFKEIYNGENLKITRLNHRKYMLIFIPMESFEESMNFDEYENGRILRTHIINGLAREGLIGDSFAYGDPSETRYLYKRAVSPGVVIGPSPLGVELFYWAHGKCDLPVSRFCNSDIQFPTLRDIFAPSKSISVRPKPYIIE